MYPYQRFICKDPERRDLLSDHVEVVTDLFTNWPELRADPLCQAPSTPAKPVSQATTLAKADDANGHAGRHTCEIVLFLESAETASASRRTPRHR